MASNACFTAFSAAAPVPILHYYGLEDYTTAKKTLISALLLKGDKVERRGVSEGYLSPLNYHYYGHIPKKPCEKMYFEAGLRLPISNTYYAHLKYYINQLMLY